MNILNTLANPTDSEPEYDIAICSICHWTGPVSECQKGRDGDWETGYYDIHLCPKCKDGGCIDDYSMTDERAREWEVWNANRVDFSD